MIIETNDIEIINQFLTNFNTSVEKIGIYNKNYIYTVDNLNVGYISYDYIYDRIELTYIYVDKDYRNKGVASKLIDFMIAESKNFACSNITLEVNENNIGAINLYTKYGFKVVSKRKNYYGSEDGLLMIREMI